MIRNLIVTSLRSIKKHKAYSIINILGLSVGMLAFMLMIEYYFTESSFDRHYVDHHKVYRIVSQKIKEGSVQQGKSSTSVYLAPFLRGHFDDFQSIVRIHKLDAKLQIVTVKDGLGIDRVFEETKGYHAESTFFDVFKTDLIAGDPITALKEPNSIVLTESIANKYFGNGDAVGQTITMLDDFEMHYIITGVVPDPPITTHFRYDYLISFSTFEKQRPHWRWKSWDWDYFHTYAKMKPNVLVNGLDNRITEAVALAGKEVFEGGNFQMKYSLQPLTDIHSFSNLENEFQVNGNGEMMAYILIVAVFIMVMAWVNYINLTTARAANRAREVGIRKVLGADRKSLIIQFLLESLVLNTSAFTIATLACFLVNPLVTEIIGYTLPLQLIHSMNFWLVALSILILGSFLSGFYPALIITGFKPQVVLKGIFSTSKRALNLRKFLVFFQFTVTILLMAGLLNVYRQISFLQHKDLGFDPKQVVIANNPRLNVDNEDTFWSKMDYFRMVSKQYPNVESITTTSDIPGIYFDLLMEFKLSHESREEAKLLKLSGAGYNYLDVFDIDLISGRQFSSERHTDGYEVMLNLSGMKSLGIANADNAIGQTVNMITFSGAILDCKIVGIFPDYNQMALSEVEPIAILNDRIYDNYRFANFMAFRIKNENVTQTLDDLKSEFESIFSGNHFSYFFLDDKFNQQYKRDEQFKGVFATFTLIALLIASLGLIALSSYTVFQRRKEISVRKVLGAKLKSLTLLFTRQYFGLICLSSVISVPLAYLLIEQWMQKFPYHVDFDVLFYLMPVLIILMLAIIMTGYHVFVIGSKNPIEHLREE